MDFPVWLVYVFNKKFGKVSCGSLQVPKIIYPKKLWAPKNLRAHKNCGSQNILGLTNFCLKKLLGQHEILCGKNFVSKKYFGSKKKLVKKVLG